MRALTSARRIVIVSVLAALACAPAEVVLAAALPGDDVTGLVERADVVAVAREALGEVVVARRALVAVEALVVLLARALPAADLAHAPDGAVAVAVTRLAVRVVVVAVVALLAVWRKEFGAALALARALRAVARRVEHVALAGLAHVRVVQHLVVRPEEARLALVAVDALGVMLAVLADAAALVHAVDVDGEALSVHFFVENALVCVAVAVAGWKEKCVIALIIKTGIHSIIFPSIKTIHRIVMHIPLYALTITSKINYISL